MPYAAFSFSEQTNEIRKKVDVKRVLDFIQKIVKNSLHEQHYKQIGRLPKFFNTAEKQRIDQYEVDMWPGYSCAVKCLTDGFFLNVDTSTKFLQ